MPGIPIAGSSSSCTPSTPTGYRGDGDLRPEDREKISALYDGAIRWTDETLGCLLGALKEQGLMDSTLIVIFPDHGEELWDRGSVLHAHTVYKELIHVPVILWNSAPPIISEG